MPDSQSGASAWSFPAEIAPTGERYRIVPATASAITALVELVNGCYRGDTSRRGWTTEADLLDGQRTDEAAVAALVAEADGAVLILPGRDGLRACCHISRADERCAYLGMLSVRPDLQDAGLGRLLIAAAEDYAVSVLALRRVKMTVIALRSELIAWYGRRGYRMTGVREAFPLDDPRFGLPKRRDLDFAVLEKVL
jgi:GNAT superfamily N-acetyltransferase